MNRVTPIPQQSLNRASSRRRSIIGISLVIAVFSLVGALTLSAIFPPAVKISPATGSREVPVDTLLKISASRFRGSINSVEVKETLLDPMGTPVSEERLSGRLEGGVFMPDRGPLLKPDARYEITVNADLRQLSLTGFDTEQVIEKVTFHTVVTPAPLVTETAQAVEIGTPIVVEFNTPIEEFDYTLTPEVPSTATIDKENHTRVLISFEGYEQGQSYTLAFTAATAENGATLKQPYSQAIVTTDPLKVIFVPGDGESAVSRGARPTLTFTEDIRNPEIADSILAVEPSTLGSWEWIAADTLEFRPLDTWTEGAQVTISLKGGTEGLRGVSGSYLREDVQSTFTIKPSKFIDVNLSAQTVTLYEHDQQVRTMICSSGSKATPSLTGTYAVYAKAEKLDMEGEGYSAPDVPWVLMFNGDYTIHGNYWATTFGVPSSHGCVGLPVPDAEFLYNWAPIGTIVSIHY